MFIKSLTIRKNGKKGEIVREIIFRKGVNLIIDNTSSFIDNPETGNNVGKTTVLRLIDFCLGGKKEKIYQDPEFKGRNEEGNKIKQFLVEKEVYVELVLVKILDNESEKIIIGRNFLNRKNKIQEINNESIVNDDFPKKLAELTLGSLLEKPSFRQVIGRNVRYSSQALSHTVKPLHLTTSNAEYEAIYLYWLGIASNSNKIELTTKLSSEKTYRKQIEDSQGDNLNAVTQKIITYDRQIKQLNRQKERFNLNENYTQDLDKLNQVKQTINGLKTQIVSLAMKKNLILESQTELDKATPDIENNKVKLIYSEVKKLLPDLHKRFEDILSFHNSMISEKKKFIGQELPQLDTDSEECEKRKNKLLEEEKVLSEKLQKTGALEELEKLIEQLTKQHEGKGRLEKVKELLTSSENKISEFEEQLNKINEQLKNQESEVERRITLFNKYFSEKSKALYGELFLLSHDFSTIKGQTSLKLEISGLEENPGTGGKRGEIIAFDLAYIEFAEKLKIPHLNFILHDQIENIHDNQISTILLSLVRKINCQYIVPVLRDKLPQEVDTNTYSILSLSQNNKLFKIP
ncbi:MAG: DUF2326 domain-containing protein [Urechidicola sp.]|nr:DUF2326 domain-containing protein [Urechidicola sp.]